MSPRLSSVPGAGSCLNTCPSATLLDLPVRGSPTRSFLVSQSSTALAVQPSKSWSAGAFSLPLLTQMSTVAPSRILVPPVGDWRLTEPSATRSEYSSCTPTLKPSFSSALTAAALVRPTTLGTATLLPLIVHQRATATAAMIASSRMTRMSGHLDFLRRGGMGWSSTEVVPRGAHHARALAVGVEGGRLDGAALPGGAHVARELRRRLVAVGRVLGHRLEHDLVHGVGHARHQLGRLDRHLVDVLERDRHGAVALERDGAGQHLVEADADRVEVRTLVDRIALGLLGREVLGGAEDRAGLRHPGIAGARDAEVHDLDGPVAVDHDVLRLDVAVHDAAAMREVDRGEQLQRDRDRLVAAEAAAPADEVLERLALHVLHDDVVRAVDLAPVVDGDQVLLVEARCGLGLAAEALDERRVAEVAREQDLDGDVPAEGEVLAQIHIGHAAAAELAHHAVPAADHLFWLEHVTHV